MCIWCGAYTELMCRYAGDKVLHIRLCYNLVLKLSKSGSGVWAPFPLSLDQNLEVWFPQNDTKPPKVFRIDENWPKERPVSEEIPTFERKWAKLG